MGCSRYSHYSFIILGRFLQRAARSRHANPFSRSRARRCCVVIFSCVCICRQQFLDENLFAMSHPLDFCCCLPAQCKGKCELWSLLDQRAAELSVCKFSRESENIKLYTSFSCKEQFLYVGLFMIDLCS